MTSPQDASMPPQELQHSIVLYAGFWRRFVASFLDGLITSAAGGVIFIIFMLAIAGGEKAGVSDSFLKVFGASGFAFLILIGIVGHWLYFALMESSANCATVGKLAMGLRVTDMNGNKISFGQATGRYFGKIVSAIILYIGFLMVAWTQKKQGLHDIMAETLVLRKGDVVPTSVAQNAFPG